MTSRRLHPATIFVSVLQVAKSLAWVIGIVLAIRLMGGRASTFELVLAGMGALRVAGAVMTYWTTRYSVESAMEGGRIGVAAGQEAEAPPPSPVGQPGGPDVLIVETGLIFRKRRVVPVNRIQSINIKRDIAHRLFGVVELSVETAAGTNAEVELSALSATEAEALRGELLARQHGATAAEASGESSVGSGAEVSREGVEGTVRGEVVAKGGRVAEEVPVVVYSAGLRDLLIAGATRTKVGTVVGGLIGLFFFFQQFFGGREERVVRKVVRDNLPMFEMDTWRLVEIGLGAVLLAVLAGWLLSMGQSVVSYYNFRLERFESGKLMRRFGLLTLHESAFPRHRLQRLTIESGILQRRVGICVVRAHTAASYTEKDAGGTALLCPVTRIKLVDDMVGQVLSGFALDEVRWESISRRAILRWTVRSSVSLSVPVLGASAVWSWWFAVGMVPVVVLAYTLARLNYRATRWAIHNDLLVVRRGILTRHIELVPRRKIQFSKVSQSPLQRWAGLASMRISTAASGLGWDAEIPMLDRRTAIALQDEVIRSAG